MKKVFVQIDPALKSFVYQLMDYSMDLKALVNDLDGLVSKGMTIETEDIAELASVIKDRHDGVLALTEYFDFIRKTQGL